MRKISLLAPLTSLILPVALLAAGPVLSDTGHLRAQLPPGLCLECIWERILYEDWHKTPGYAVEHKLTKKISDAVAANDIKTLVKFATMPTVNLFGDRSAIQILGCDGEIVGHVPLDRTLLARIEAATAELLQP